MAYLPQQRDLNLCTNPRAIDHVRGWTLYDSNDAEPISFGVATGTLIKNDNTVFGFTKSEGFKWTPGADQGEGVYFPVTLPSGLQGQNFIVRFKYNITSGATITPYIVASTVINVDETLPSLSTTVGTYEYVARFTAPADNFRFCLHNTSATAATVRFNEVEIRQDNELPGVKQWQADYKYVVDDTVIYQNQIYKCLTANTDGSFTGSKWLALSSASSGTLNYITDGDAETASITSPLTSLWERYNDSAARPVDGTGNAPTDAQLTFVKSSSAPLFGTSSLVLTKVENAASAQGKGVSYLLTLDAGMLTKMAEITFDYNGTHATGDFQVFYINDQSGSISTYLIGDIAAGVGPFRGSFQVGYTGTHRIAIHIGSTTATTFNVKLDNISVKPQAPAVLGAVDVYLGELVTTGTWTTNASYAGKYWRIGDKLRGIVRVSVSGQPDNTALRLYLPNGLSVDDSKLPNVSTDNYYYKFGTVEFRDSGAGSRDGFVNYQPTVLTRLEIMYANTTVSGVVAHSNISQIAPFEWVSGDYILINYEVPILGWSSNQVLSESTSNRSLFAAYKVSSGVSSSTTQPLDYGTKDYDDAVSVTTGSAWKYTAKEDGKYKVIVNYLSSAGDTDIYLYVNGSQGKSLGTAKAAVGLNGTIEIPLSKDQYIDIRSSVNQAVANDARFNWITIDKLNTGSQTIAQSQKTRIRYRATSGSVTNSLLQPSTFTAKEVDSHGLWNAANSSFVANRDGVLSGEVQITQTNTPVWVIGSAVRIILYVNGVIKARTHYSVLASSGVDVGTVLLRFSNISVSKGQLVTVYCDSTQLFTLSNADNLNLMSFIIED